MGEYVIFLHPSHRVYFIAYSIPRGHVVYKAYGMCQDLRPPNPTFEALTTNAAPKDDARALI